MLDRLPDNEAIEGEIDRVRSLGLDELRTLWRTTLRSSPPPALTKDLVAPPARHDGALLAAAGELLVAMGGGFGEAGVFDGLAFTRGPSVFSPRAAGPVAVAP